VTVRMGPMLPSFDPMGTGIYDIAARSRRAESLGFDSLWAGDHLAFRSPILDSGMVLATAAGVTVRPTIGYSVMLLALRNPAWAAKQIATLQVLSGNRLVLGVGVGGESSAEWVASGVDTTSRGARTDAMLEGFPAALQGEIVSVCGMTVPGLRPEASMPEVWVGGRSDAALKRAVRFGSAWVGAFVDATKTNAIRARLIELADEDRRPVPALAMTVFVYATAATSQAKRRAAEDEAGAYLMAQYGVPWDRMSRYTSIGSVSELVEQLELFREAGVGDFVMMPVARDVDRQWELLAEVHAEMV
jgi:alkanesulfonate monooxygenase SsuD/methylene tetrahydromethanopterin reductase-like flavin-dependent oxidoreductase (luciferase family)